MSKYQSIKKVILTAIEKKETHFNIPISYNSITIDIINDLNEIIPNVWNDLLQNIHSQGNGYYIIEYIRRN